jgi:hypothetical protein
MSVSVCVRFGDQVLTLVVWERPNFYSSPSISRSLDAGIEVSGLAKDEIDLYDFYSCFPIVPKLASAHLGLPIVKGSKPVTLLGGLTSFGGAGNNYSMHVSCSLKISSRVKLMLAGFDADGAKSQKRQISQWVDPCKWRRLHISACDLPFFATQKRRLSIPSEESSAPCCHRLVCAASGCSS